MAIGVEGIYIAPIVEDGGNGSRMNTAHMVDLGIGLHGDFPVAIQIENGSGRQTTVVKLELSPFVSDWPQPFQQADRLRVEVDKNQVAKLFAAHLP